MKKNFKKDLIIISIITIIYSIISFINLGSFTDPQTFWNVENVGEYIVLEIEEIEVSKIRHYTGPRFGTYKLYTSNDGEKFEFCTNLEQTSVFAWSDLEVNEKFRYLKIVGQTEDSYLGDIAIYNKNEERVKVYAINQEANLIIDEEKCVPEEISFINSTYFDEIYHPRTAYEYVHGIDVYEWTHPPLGKLLMAIPISMLGMCPFAYRLMGNIAGILMLPIIYILAKDMFKSRKYAIVAAIIMACDNFHFAQTRLATVDSFLVLFIMLSFMFMYKYIILTDKDKIKTKLKMLFFSGLFMACSISTKWTGCFAAIGLAIIFFANLIKTNAIDKFEFSKNGINIRFKEKKWSKETTVIILSCITFFVILPIIIYLLCYIPDKNVKTLEDVWNLQINMYKYHSELEAEHPFTSNWYTWFIMKKPVWYYSGTVESGMHSTISGIGNPIIWWTGIAGMVYVLIKGLRKLDVNCWFIIVAILTALIPYLSISRIMFMYHYFPVLPFMMLSIVMLIKDIENKVRFKKIYLIYIIIIVAMFIYYYPVVSGMTVSEEYIEATKWLDSWYY
ncbi:MAG: phospholipid carrier-dependent glycosyltransferase [Clostridia bacterium]|nr:phospholipid carrier-dependent glycosyltransferase [Clostridia bacterium]